jgi:hypothetical protein
MVEPTETRDGAGIFEDVAVIDVVEHGPPNIGNPEGQGYGSNAAYGPGSSGSTVFCRHSPQ